jgi:hypothetical protein
MLSREDFVFTIGYDGPSAVVDGQAKKRFGGLSTKELAEQGLFRAAYSSALYAKSPEDIQIVVELYNKAMEGTEQAPVSADSPLDRLVGVFPPDSGVQAQVTKALSL